MDKELEHYNEEEKRDSVTEEMLSDDAVKDVTDFSDEELGFDDNEEAAERLREFESSVNKSFKRTIILSTVILAIAVVTGVVLTTVL